MEKKKRNNYFLKKRYIFNFYLVTLQTYLGWVINENMNNKTFYNIVLRIEV